MEAPPKPGMNCPNCFYFCRSSDISGECRRRAPVPNPLFFMLRGAVGDIKVDVHWPKVYDHNWCGEYQPRSAAD